MIKCNHANTITITITFYRNRERGGERVRVRDELALRKVCARAAAQLARVKQHRASHLSRQVHVQAEGHLRTLEGGGCTPRL